MPSMAGIQSGNRCLIAALGRVRSSAESRLTDASPPDESRVQHSGGIWKWTAAHSPIVAVITTTLEKMNRQL